MQISVIELLVIIVISGAAGAFLYHTFFAKIEELTKSQIAVVTRSIEDLRLSGGATYSSLLTEWNTFLTDDKASISEVSDTLKSIIAQVKR